jgi:hypothetical protein
MATTTRVSAGGKGKPRLLGRDVDAEDMESYHHKEGG